MLIVFSVSTEANAAWKVISFYDKFYLEYKGNANVRVPLVVHAGGPKFLKVVKTKIKNIEMVIYNSGETGTQVIIAQWRALIFNKKTKKVLADLPYRYHANQKKFRPNQPKWMIKPSSIRVVDESTNLDRIVRF